MSDPQYDWRIGNDKVPPRWFIFRRTADGQTRYALTGWFRSATTAQRAADLLNNREVPV